MNRCENLPPVKSAEKDIWSWLHYPLTAGCLLSSFCLCFITPPLSAISARPPLFSAALCALPLVSFTFCRSFFWLGSRSATNPPGGCLPLGCCSCSGFSTAGWGPWCCSVSAAAAAAAAGGRWPCCHLDSPAWAQSSPTSPPLFPRSGLFTASQTQQGQTERVWRRHRQGDVRSLRRCCVNLYGFILWLTQHYIARWCGPTYQHRHNY